MKYKVIDPKGVLVSGQIFKEGSILPATETTSAQVRAFLRFKQIVKIEEKKPEPPKAPSTVDELKAALTELGVAIPDDAKKADLEKLYAESQAAKE